MSTKVPSDGFRLIAGQESFLEAVVNRMEVGDRSGSLPLHRLQVTGDKLRGEGVERGVVQQEAVVSIASGLRNVQGESGSWDDRVGDLSRGRHHGSRGNGKFVERLESKGVLPGDYFRIAIGLESVVVGREVDFDDGR